MHSLRLWRGVPELCRREGEDFGPIFGAIFGVRFVGGWKPPSGKLLQQ